ncbi:MAG TPA: hypothetical protein VGO67_16750 [Verrucomicrobiae bacterium]|jgi:hypothetical protein
MTNAAGDGVIVDEILRDDPDCPVFGFNLACAYPFPEAAAQFYRPIAARLAALDPGVYVYPDWETHITIVTFVNFNLHRKPAATLRAQLELLLNPVCKILRKILEATRSFHLTIGAPMLTPKAAILPVSDDSGDVARIRRNVLDAFKSNAELYDQLARAGLNVPAIVHSTVMRFKSAPQDYKKFAADFAEISRSVTPVEIVVSELLLTTETKPYMREGKIIRSFPLAPI